MGPVNRQLRIEISSTVIEGVGVTLRIPIIPVFTEKSSDLPPHVKV